MNRTVFAAAAAIALASGSASADTEVVDGVEWTFTVSGGEASVGGGGWETTAVPRSTTGAISVPATLGGRPVTGIGEYAFRECSGVTSVSIPDRVSDIRAWAFEGCSGLVSVAIPANVTSIGFGAFASCSGLVSIAVDPDNPVFDSRNGCNAVIRTASDTLVAGCKATVIPEGVTGIGRDAFYGCSGLTSIAIPAGVTSIGDLAFCDCSGLTSFSVATGNPAFSSSNGLLLSKDGKTLIQGVNGNVTVPDCVTSIGWGAFLDCSGLASISIPDGVTNIGGYAFSGCSGLTSIAIPGTVTDIEYDAFSGCSGLTSVVIPDGVTIIENNAFADCSGLASIAIPDSVATIEPGAFANCSNLVSITVPRSFTNLLPLFGVPDGCRVATLDPLPLAFPADSTRFEEVADHVFGRRLVATGGLRPYRFEIADPSVFPGWLDIQEGTAYSLLIAWPGAEDAGTHSFTLRATDAEGARAERRFTIVVKANGKPAIESWTPEPSRVRIDPGAMVPFSVEATDPERDGLFYGWSVYRHLGDDTETLVSQWSSPSCGNTFVFDAALLGKGRYGITVRVSDLANAIWDYENNGHVAALRWNVLVDKKTPLRFRAETTLPDAWTGWRYDPPSPLNVSGGEEPYTWEIVGSGWPDWLELGFDDWYAWSDATPFLSGIPGAGDAGSHAFTLRVTDAEGTSVEKDFSLEVLDADPAVWTPGASRLPLAPGTTTGFSVAASDPEGNGLDANWVAYRVSFPTGYSEWYDNWEPWLWNSGNVFRPFFPGEGSYKVEGWISNGANSDFRSWLVQIARPVFRFYSKKYKGHFFTADAEEKDDLVRTNPNWRYEGVAYRAFAEQAQGTVALHRFYSKKYKGHFFTIDEAEKDDLIRTNPNWKYEGVAYYVHPAEVEGSVPVFRFWSKAYRHHFYTTSEAEKDDLIAHNPNWKYEGVAFWAPPAE